MRELRGYLSIFVFYDYIPDNAKGLITEQLSLYTERILWQFSTGTLGIFATLVYVFTMHVVIYDILRMAIITTLSTSILFYNSLYILLWISPRSVVKIAIRI